MANHKRQRIGAIGFAIFGIVYVVLVFRLTDDWRRRVHSAVVGGINLAAAVYLGRSTAQQNDSEDRNEP